MFSYIWNTKINYPIFNSISDKYNIDGVSPLLWREHCIECAMPLCYSTCKIYSRRMDKRCLRFDNGIVPIIQDKFCYSFISFRKWAKLESVLPINLITVPIAEINKKDKKYQFWSGVVRRISNLIHNYRLCHAFAHYHQKWVQRAKSHSLSTILGFYAQVYLLDRDERHLNIEILSNNKSVFKRLISLKNGWNEFLIPYSELNISDVKHSVIRLYFNYDETAKVIFKHLDLVSELKKNHSPAKKLKCVAWDLDNTLWKGVIGDDGKDNVQVFDESLKLIKELDERGIIQTIVSKNTPEIAWKKIEELGLSDYFLYPAINWGRKSQNLINISQELNINIDTFAMIDDSAFERNEISKTLPQVRVFDKVDIPNLLSKDEFNLPISEESKLRRQSYLNEYKRKNIKASWEGDYDSFLRECNIRMEVFKPILEKDCERCLELILRSNQYNISGIKYEEKDFLRMLEENNYDCYAFKVYDNYGDYGIVGFSSFEKHEDKYIMHDFVMSCRVAMKKIERAFLSTIVSKIDKSTYNQLLIKAVKTDRNAPLREQLKNMKLTVVSENDKEILFKLDLGNDFIDDKIVNVEIIGE